MGAPCELVVNRLCPMREGAIINSARVGRRLKTVWIIFGLGISLEIAYFRGAPGLGLIGIGPEILYTDFGIPGLHGLLNPMFYACCVSFHRSPVLNWLDDIT